MKNAHCSHCGAKFDPAAKWPRACAACGETSWLNPLPVAVLVLPVDDGVLVIRRGIPPSGKLALPGGYVDHGESWQAACARELREETNVVIDPAGIRERRVLSAPDGTLLVFGQAPRVAERSLPAFSPTSETSERLVVRAPMDLAFPLHTQVLREFFARRELP